MQKSQWMVILLVVVVILPLNSVSIMAESKAHEKVRVIAHTDKEISDAESNGCKVVREACLKII